MNDQRLKEIIELANTVLPITGSIPNAFELQRETERAIYEIEMEPYKGRQLRQLLSDLRFIHREARQSFEAFFEALLDKNSDQGDHDLR